MHKNLSLYLFFTTVSQCTGVDAGHLGASPHTSGTALWDLTTWAFEICDKSCYTVP